MISVNGQPYGSNQEKPMNMDKLNFSPRMSPNMNIYRSEKRNNTVNVPNSSLSYGINIIQSSPRKNMNEGYSSHPVNLNPNLNLHQDTNPEIHSPNHPLIFSQNSEFDEILEKNVRVKGKIDFDAHLIFKGNYLKILTSQNGSRVLQKALSNTILEIINEIFLEIGEQIPELMVDSYANYFCQKFYSYLEFENKIKFLTFMKPAVVEIGNSKIGTYPLQAVLEQLNSDEEKMIVIDSVKEKAFEMCPGMITLLIYLFHFRMRKEYM